MTTTALGLRLPRRWTARHGGRLVVRLALYAIVAAIFQSSPTMKSHQNRKNLMSLAAFRSRPAGRRSAKARRAAPGT